MQAVRGDPKRRLAFSKVAVGLALATLAALTIVGINEVSYRASNRAVTEIEQAQHVRQLLNELLQNVIDAETGQRGFLLTGEPRYRQPYDQAVTEIGGRLAALREQYAGVPAEAAQLDELGRHVSRKLVEMSISIQLRVEGQNDAWRFVIDTDVGREEMDAIRRQVSELMARSNAALQQAQTQIGSSLWLARLGIAVVTLAALIAFYLYLRQAQALRSVGERQQEALQRERNALEDEVRERTATLAELATHLQQVREDERGYLARELHDELGSLLTAAKLDVARLKSRLTEAPDAMQRLQHLNDLLNSGIALKRRIIEDLRPSSLSNLGLIASLEILGREFGEHSGLDVEMVLEPVSLDDADQLTVYRMVQESLTNITKYAQATEARIVMQNDGDQVMVEVTDNGSGFDPDRTSGASYGLAGMRHRVEAARGKLMVSSAPGAGTRVSAMLPALLPRPVAAVPAI